MRSRAFIFTFLFGAVSAAAPALAQPSAQSELERASQRLSEVTEEYNEAKLRRQQLEQQLGTARDRVERSESKLGHARSQLAVAVRDLYMHPGEQLDAIFGADDYAELQRGSALSRFVSLSLEDLILEVRRARAAEEASASSLEAMRDRAAAIEESIEERRREAATAFGRAQTLLADRALVRARDAEREADLATAGALADARIHTSGPVHPGAGKAVSTAAAQIGDPYQWGAEGPDRFDCSGLTMYAWASAGVSLPHSSRAQYASLPHVSLSNLAPGDLVFSGSPIHHVAIYEGGGTVIAAPHSGEHVRRQSVWSLNPVGAARPG